MKVVVLPTAHKDKTSQITVTIENPKGELCTEDEAVYFTFPQEKARGNGLYSL